MYIYTRKLPAFIQCIKYIHIYICIYIYTYTEINFDFLIMWQSVCFRDKFKMMFVMNTYTNIYILEIICIYIYIYIYMHRSSLSSNILSHYSNMNMYMYYKVFKIRLNGLHIPCKWNVPCKYRRF